MIFAYGSDIVYTDKEILDMFTSRKLDVKIDASMANMPKILYPKFIVNRNKLITIVREIRDSLTPPIEGTDYKQLTNTIIFSIVPVNPIKWYLDKFRSRRNAI